MIRNPLDTYWIIVHHQLQHIPYSQLSEVIGEQKQSVNRKLRGKYFN